MRVSATALFWLCSAVLSVFLIVQPISVEAQLAIALTAIVLAAAIYVLKLGGIWRHAFLALATAVVLRYAYWRTTATLPSSDDLVSFIPAMILYAAEMYCILFLFMSVFVAIDPLQRRPARQLDDDALPHVDVFVPSYNESSDILSLTLSAAKAMDYPADRLNVFLLDDGGTDQKRNARDARSAAAAQRRHVELQALCRTLGVTYLTRARNEHAKAGNLNNGLANSSSELVVVFDADHAPAREFLRETVGHFRDDEKLFLVQTPHFFSNPDPLERNLSTFDKMPSENEMFYSSIQKGLDKWNATFFCGSAAVLRRRALDQVGGFAGVTITEDCETALELHSRGWTSRYVDRPMVTGLQPETLSSFIGQRSRWCQGMIQIFLLKNPIFKPNLSIAQKICYLSSSMCWFFPLPRMVFLLSPLLFIFFDLKIFDVSTQEFVAYTLTYLAINTLIRNYLYGSVRWPFVSELYEYVQTVYLFRAVFSVLFNPRRPTFNVTAKGETMKEDRLSPLALPYFGIFAILVAAFVYSIYRYQTEPQVGGILLVVAAWNVLNLLIAGAALGVVTERRERRQAPRTISDRAATLVIDNAEIPIQVDDTSLSGAKVTPLGPIPNLHGGRRGHIVVTGLGSRGELGRIPVSLRSVIQWDGTVSIGLRYEADASDYAMIAELMMGDMEAVRHQREARRRPRGMIKGGMTIVLWGVRYPLKAFRHLVFDRNGTKAETVSATETSIAPSIAPVSAADAH
ncbi:MULTISPECIES: UDP-forming cellulose synthase catalytic subunit [unclassified Aureimonas]|uniref:UDP-forming cellulose synthase catalytic subunit n=1 Tax=unclassified Aureimonas TaxID=2615206 RepID=UPI0006F52F1E|nr:MULTISPECIES: UDP-forming cellulose synthase catalytic subunit [unclassified Aureimonas]KQT64009.1 cellulose synthase [Aureimonas sp. Leaf427]KQT81202.1 cellulose synthase [Aureimonas sp. Leaf460]